MPRSFQNYDDTDFLSYDPPPPYGSLPTSNGPSQDATSHSAWSTYRHTSARDRGGSHASSAATGASRSDIAIPPSAAIVSPPSYRSSVGARVNSYPQQSSQIDTVRLFTKKAIYDSMCSFEQASHVMNTRPLQPASKIYNRPRGSVMWSVEGQRWANDVRSLLTARADLAKVDRMHDSYTNTRSNVIDEDTGRLMAHHISVYTDRWNDLEKMLERVYSNTSYMSTLESVERDAEMLEGELREFGHTLETEEQLRRQGKERLEDRARGSRYYGTFQSLHDLLEDSAQ